MNIERTNELREQTRENTRCEIGIELLVYCSHNENCSDCDCRKLEFNEGNDRKIEGKKGNFIRRAIKGRFYSVDAMYRVSWKLLTREIDA